MKINLKPKYLKFLILATGFIGLVLRIALYKTGFDGRGLLEQNHPAAIALWILTIGTGLVLLLSGLSIRGGKEYADAFPVSFAAFAGCFAAAAGIGLTQLQSFGDFRSPLDIFIWVLGLAAAASLAGVGICRLIRVKPYCLLHGVVCVYFALRMITQYRLWSSAPCLMDYFFYLAAHLALMLTAYQLAAFDTDMGSHRALWLSALGGLYLCCVAVYGCSDIPLIIGCGIWCFTSLTNLTEQKRRPRPVMETEE